MYECTLDVAFWKGLNLKKIQTRVFEKYILKKGLTVPSCIIMYKLK